MSRPGFGSFGDGGGFALDVGEDGGDFGDVVAHLGFEGGDDVVGFAERHALVYFKVLLDVERAVVLLDADVVDGEVGAGGYGSYAVEDALAEGGRGDSVDDYVRTGQAGLDGGCGCEGDLLGALEREVAGHAEGDVGEVAGAGAAGADAVDGHDAVDGQKVVDRSRCGSFRGLREVWRRGGVDGVVGECPGDSEDDGGDGERGDGVGVLEGGMWSFLRRRQR